MEEENVYDLCPICAGSSRDTLERVAEARGVNVQNLERGLGGRYEPNIHDYNPIDGTFACCRCNAGLLPTVVNEANVTDRLMYG
jgi:hypothetical protein